MSVVNQPVRVSSLTGFSFCGQYNYKLPQVTAQKQLDTLL